MQSKDEKIVIGENTDVTDQKSVEEMEKSEVEDVSLRSMHNPGHYKYKPKSKICSFLKECISYKLLVLLFLLFFALFLDDKTISFYTTNIFDRQNFVYFTSSHKIFFNRKKVLFFAFWAYFSTIILESIIFFVTDALSRKYETLYILLTNLNTISFHLAFTIVIFVSFMLINDINFYIFDISFLQLICVIFLTILLLALLKILFKQLSSDLIDRNCINNMIDCIFLEGFLKIFSGLNRRSSKRRVFRKINSHLGCLKNDYAYFESENISHYTKLKLHKYFSKDFFFYSLTDIQNNDLVIKHVAYKTFIDFCQNNPNFVFLRSEQLVELGENEYARLEEPNEIIFIENEEKMSTISEPNFYREDENDDTETEDMPVESYNNTNRLEILEIILCSNQEVIIKHMDSFYKTNLKNLRVPLRHFFTSLPRIFFDKLRKRFNLTESINVEDFHHLLKYLYKKKLNIQNNFNARYAVLKSSHNFLIILILVFSFLCLYCGFKVEDKDIVSFLYTFFSLASLLQCFATELFESVLNIIFIHPYDVGDLISVNINKKDIICTVKQINALTTTLTTFDNKIVYFYNTLLKEQVILNYHKSNYISTVIILRLKRRFDFYKLEKLKQEFSNFLHDHKSEGYDSSVTIGISDYEKEDKAVIKLFYKINNNSLSYFRLQELRSQALEQVILLLQDKGLEYNKRELTINFQRVMNNT